MARRGGFSGGMPNNMNNLMKQAQKMQKKMQEMQEDLDSQVFEDSAGGGAVKVTVTGKKEVTKVSIDPEVVDEDDVEMLEDLILAAVNEAMRTADEKVNQQMSKVTGGLNMPGLF